MKELLKKFKKLNLPQDKYAIYGSRPMAIRGIRKAKDLDVAVKNSLFKELLKKYKEIRPGHIKINNIEIYASWNSYIDNADEVINCADLIDGFKFIKLEDLIKWKNKLGRKKDLKDIALMKKYLSNRN